MQISTRHYDRDHDFARVGQFLIRTYRTTGDHINWLQPRWEYMHYHPLIWNLDLTRIGVWEAEGEIVAVVHPEHSLGRAYIELDPAFGFLKKEMLRYAEEYLFAETNGVRFLRLYMNDENSDLQRIAAEMGYRQEVKGAEVMAHLPIPTPFPAISVPKGFRLKNLAEDDNVHKVHRALWRGFDHGDEPPDDGVKGRKLMQSAPNFMKDLNIVVEAPDGNFVAYCGMWYEPANRFAYVEPVATDPDYRRRGLGRAAVLEGIRRCGVLGATVAYVGSAQPFYQALGFRQISRDSAWLKEWR
jgi:predicted N-acetyltransferase YhbS